MSQAASSGNSRPILGVSKSQEGDAGKKKKLETFPWKKNTNGSRNYQPLPTFGMVSDP
jgi:hypothetical protein